MGPQAGYHNNLRVGHRVSYQSVLAPNTLLALGTQEGTGVSLIFQHNFEGA